MKNTTIPTLPKFKSAAGSNFSKELRANVESYFKKADISKFANGALKFKAILLLVSFFGAYFLILFSGWSAWLIWSLCIFLGIVKAGIGMGLMHDANHGSFSKNRIVNKIFSYTADFLGVSSSNWVNQHNKLHHTYT
jgi:linoleoyl-CoA desaturase